MLVGQGEGMAENVMLFCISQLCFPRGEEVIVGENGIVALVEAIEDGSVNAKGVYILDFVAIVTKSVGNKGLLVREGGISPSSPFRKPAVSGLNIKKLPFTPAFSIHRSLYMDCNIAI